MEDVLELSPEPYDPQRLVVCYDETSTQLLAETRTPIPAAPGRPRREDYEYQRAGTRNLFLNLRAQGWLAPRGDHQAAYHAGLRPPGMCWLVDQVYPDVPVVRLILDNLDTHQTASLYRTFPQQRLGASPSGWSSTTRPSTGAG